jgi:hypothetical protein
MSSKNPNFTASLRIIWTIARKDIIDALKNRTNLGVIFSALFLMLVFHDMPELENGDFLPRIVIYDNGNSSLVSQLESNFHFPCCRRMGLAPFRPMNAY